MSNRSASSKKTSIGVRWTCVARLAALSSAKRIVYARAFRTKTRLDEQLRGMWKIDSLGVRNSDDNQLIQEEILALSTVEKSRRRIRDYYEEAIPWKDEFY